MNNKKYYLVLVVFFVVTACQRGSKPHTTGPAKIRVLGYLHTSGDWASEVRSLDLSAITDLNLAFFNPAEDGSMPVSTSLQEAVRLAHDKGVKVYLSLGGGMPPAHLGSWITAAKRDIFISNILAFARNYKFDGIDVDLENALINEDYPGFVSALSKQVKSAGLKMTAALASWNGDLIHDSTLRLYDYINIMSYDQTGPWRPDRPGQHAPYSMVENDFKYYHLQRGIPADRLLIGLPFYGYGFGLGAPESMTYKNIVAAYPGSEQQDSVMIGTEATVYYNGIPTIRRKTAFAIEKRAAGVMIWQLKGDASGDKSLLKAINEAAR